MGFCNDHAIRTQLTGVIRGFFKWWVPLFFVKTGDRSD